MNEQKIAIAHFNTQSRVGLLSTPVRSPIKGRTNLRFGTIAESNYFMWLSRDDVSMVLVVL